MPRMLRSSGLARWRSRLGVVCTVFVLSACAGLGAPQRVDPGLPERAALGDFALEGRFALRHEENNYSGRLSWRHARAGDELLLASPLGQGLAEIRSEARGVRLTTSDGKVYTATDVETLTDEVLGYPLPLVQLADWVRGRTGSAEVESDEFGRPLRLRTDGWRIDYTYDDDSPQALPGRLFAERAGVLELRLRIEEWRSVGDAPGQSPEK